MTKTRKIWLGILTFLPLVFLITYFIFFFLFIFKTFGNIHRLEAMENNPGQFPAEFMANFAIMFLFIILSSFLSLGLLIYYIIHANNNIANDSNKKLMWTLILIFTSSIGSIVYYFVEILPYKTIDDKIKAL
ncbi:PLDc N-terminal domain-containing protein [Lacinutrix jangbogonensis]|uniref:PLDc N-terminal domain-containing protein n=1 Tax=Lacinutrix jangbogonensis TaxID=1469557 RepID=UPI00053EE926|nr:PLDc N-terminal domain-containing protein [Lacinutrix jangbogonensis]